MQIYSRYSAVNTVSGDPVTVREALAAINHAIEEYFEAQEGEIDPESRFCVNRLKEHGYAEGGYGEAELLSQAMNVAIDSDSMSGLLTAEAGRVKLRRMDDYGPDRPLSTGMTAWEGCMRMAYHLNREYGEGVAGAANVARQMVRRRRGRRIRRAPRPHPLQPLRPQQRLTQRRHLQQPGDKSWQDILTQMQEAQSERLL